MSFTAASNLAIFNLPIEFPKTKKNGIHKTISTGIHRKVNLITGILKICPHYTPSIENKSALENKG